MRAFVIALVTVLVSALSHSAAAQTAPPQVPVTVAGGTPGVSIEFYLNAGKVADAVVDATGGTNWLLDMSNMGKTKLTVYIDVCKDGKVVKVMFVAANGEAPPKDEDCDSRIAVLSFQTDCAGLHVNLNFGDFGASNTGACVVRTTLRDPKIIGSAAGGAVLIAVLAGGGGDSGATTPGFNAPPPPSQTTSGQQPSAQPPAQQPPTSTQPPAAPPRASATGSYRCTQTAIVSDPGRHNPTLRVADQLVNLLSVTEQGNTLTIRHPAPFIDIVNATFDPATGRFSGTTRGNIAGFSNVGVSYEGTYDAATGRMQFNYTLGTGGEFPGGLAITYQFTIQKQ